MKSDKGQFDEIGDAPDGWQWFTPEAMDAASEEHGPGSGAGSKAHGKGKGKKSIKETNESFEHNLNEASKNPPF